MVPVNRSYYMKEKKESNQPKPWSTFSFSVIKVVAPV